MGAALTRRGRYHARVPRCPVCTRRLRGGATCPGDGSIAAAERARDPGPRPAIPGFELGEILGVGGAGAVWAARGDGRDAAIKVATAATSLWRARFASEANAMAALGVPHAPRLFARDLLPDGRPWIAMERVAGASLAGAAGRHGGPVARERALAGRCGAGRRRRRPWPRPRAPRPQAGEPLHPPCRSGRSCRSGRDADRFRSRHRRAGRRADRVARLGAGHARLHGARGAGRRVRAMRAPTSTLSARSSTSCSRCGPRSRATPPSSSAPT